MNKTLKWILISLGILVGLAFLAAAVFMLVRGIGFHPQFTDGRFYGRGFFPHGGMMFGMGFLMLGRLLIPAGVIALAVVGVISLIRSKKTTSVAPVEPPAELLKACPKCGKPVQPDWTHCAHCGKKQ